MTQAQAPAKAEVRTGWACNNACVFCNQAALREAGGDAPGREAIGAAMRVAREGGADAIVLGGGEITLRADLGELVSGAKALGFRAIEVQTNGRALAYKRVVDTLARCGATTVVVGLQGDGAVGHDWHTRVPGSFEQSVAGARNAVAAGLRVAVSTVVTRSNARNLLGIVKTALPLGVAEVRFHVARPVGDAAARFQAIVPRYTMMAPHLHAALKLAIAARRRAYVRGVPMCFLRGHEACALERFGVPVEIDVATATPRPSATHAARVQGPPCEACSFASACLGPHEAYARRYGWSEFKAREDAPSPKLATRTAKEGTR